MRRFPLLLSLVLLAACDSEGGPLAYQGVEVTARGDAELAVEDGALVVSGLEGSRSGGFTVAGQPARVDVEIDPLAIAPGGRFGIEVADDAGRLLASFYNTASAQGVVDYVFDFGSTYAASAAVVVYRLGGEAGSVVARGTLSLGSGRVSVARRRAPSSAGSGSGDTGSTHVIREGGRYVVVTDSGDDGARRGCSGFFLTPPVEVDPDGRTICSDWIEVQPVTPVAVPEGTVSCTARGVGTFRVRQLRAR